MFVNASKGMSAVQLSRDLNVQYKTAFVLMHKLREAMAVETADTKLSNTVEVDGAYFGGHVRPANAKKIELIAGFWRTALASGASSLPCASAAGAP